MPEQLNLDFDTPRPEPQAESQDLTALSDERLAELYKQSIGIDPKIRGFDRSTMLMDLADPTQAKERIRIIDAEYDGIGEAWGGKK